MQHYALCNVPYRNGTPLQVAPLRLFRHTEQTPTLKPAPAAGEGFLHCSVAGRTANDMEGGTAIGSI